MSSETGLDRGRAAAEALMVDTCSIARPAGESTSSTGVVTPATTAIYSGKARLQFKAETGTGRTVGEAYVIEQRPQLQLPISAPEIAEGDVVTWTASALDSQLVGKTFVVRDVVRKTHLTARRATVIEVTS